MNKALKGKLKDQFAVKKTSYGFGLFAKVPFKRGDYIIEYTGEKITNEEADRRAGKYLMTLDDHYTLDGKDRKHAARYINHSCKPNCIAYIEDDNRVCLYAKRTIQPGEELTYDYGKEYFDAYIKPHGCKCDRCHSK